MPAAEYEIAFPFPASHLELMLGVRDEPVALREYALTLEATDPSGAPIPRGLLNWGYSQPLGGCYQYVPDAAAGSWASIPLPLLTSAPVGGVKVRVLAWKPLVPGTDPHDIFDLLMITFSTARQPDGVSAGRFSTAQRSTRD